MIFAVEKETPESAALIPLQPTIAMLPAITVPDESLAGYPIADGSFVKVAGGDGTVYEMVGGAPVPVTNAAHVGGTPIIGTISAGQFDNQAQLPADGTFVKNASGTVYEFAGGAPIVVTNSGHVTGEPSLLPEIDQTAIDNAGSGGPFNHINQFPADGTFVTATVPGTTTTNAYEFAGGAPSPFRTSAIWADRLRRRSRRSTRRRWTTRAPAARSTTCGSSRPTARL